MKKRMIDLKLMKNPSPPEVDSTQMDGISQGATVTDILSALDSLAHLEHIKNQLLKSKEVLK